MDNTIPLNTSDNNPRKRCTGPCGKEFSATLEFFSKSKRGKYGVRSRCRSCESKNSQVWAANHQEHIRAYSIEYKQRSGTKERHRLLERERRKRSDVKAYQRAHDKAKQARPEYREKERLRSKMRYYQPGGKEKVTARYHLRRARLQASSGTYAPSQIQTKLKKQRHRCYYCMAEFVKQKQKYKYHIEHVIPLSRGGTNDIDNIVLSCPLCNLKKGNKLPHEFAEGGRLL